jgi:hypothetical protein
VAAALYALTGIHEPWMVLPVHGLLWALTAWVLFDIARMLGVSENRAWLATLPVFLLPSSAMVWGQLHKDIYSIPGTLLVVRHWMIVGQVARGEPMSWRRVLAVLLWLLIGMLLVWFVRPYLANILLLPSILVGASVFLWMLGKRDIRVAAIVLVLVSLVLQISITKLHLQTQTQSCTHWSPEIRIPVIDAYAANLSCAREAFRKSYPEAGSNIDADVEIRNYRDYLDYLPRALQVGLFSPFPETWFSEGVSPGSGAMRAIAALETAMFYVALLVLVLFGRNALSNQVHICVLFALAIILVQTYAITNVGTLYRMRFPAWLLLFATAISVWVLSKQKSMPRI